MPVGRAGGTAAKITMYRCQALEAVLKVMKCVVWTEKAVAQGTFEMGYPHRAISLECNAAPGSFPSKPFGQRLLWVVAGVGHEGQGLQAWAPSACLAQQPKSISATRFSTFKTASKRL
jgi:hypothetical protein